MEFYPRYLIYENLDDRARISTCIYYMIRHMVLRKFYQSNTNRRKSSARNENVRLDIQDSQVLNVRACRLPAEASGVEEDTSSESDNDSSGEYCESGLAEVSDIATPTGSIVLPGPSNTSRRLSSRALPNRPVSDSNVTTRLGACLRRPTPLPPSQIQRPTPLERLQKGFKKRQKESDTFNKPNARKMLCQNLSGSKKRQSHGIPSTDQRPPATLRDSTGRGSSSKVTSSVRSASTPSSENLDVYIGSQEGEDFLNESEEDSTSTPAHGSTSGRTQRVSRENTVLATSPRVVPTSTRSRERLLSTQPMPRAHLVTKSDNLGNKYDSLTSELLDLLETCAPESQNLIALKRTVQYIREITVDTFGNTLECYQSTLDRWMECLDALIKCREVTGLQGNRASWAGSFKNLTSEKRKVARATFFNARLGLFKWRKESGFHEASEDLALLFFNIVDWAGMMELEELEELLKKFNEKLFAWFA